MWYNLRKLALPPSEGDGRQHWPLKEGSLYLAGLQLGIDIPIPTTKSSIGIPIPTIYLLLNPTTKYLLLNPIPTTKSS